MICVFLFIRAWQRPSDANAASHQQSTPADASLVSWPVLLNKPNNGESATQAVTSITNTGLPDTSPLMAPDAEITENPVLPVGDSMSGGAHKDDTPGHVGGTLRSDTFLMDTAGEAAGVSDIRHDNRHTAADLVNADAGVQTEQLVHVTTDPVGKYTFRGLGAVNLINLTPEAVSEAQLAKDSKTSGAIGKGQVWVYCLVDFYTHAVVDCCSTDWLLPV